MFIQDVQIERILQRGLFLRPSGYSGTLERNSKVEMKITEQIMTVIF